MDVLGVVFQKYVRIGIGNTLGLCAYCVLGVDSVSVIPIGKLPFDKKKASNYGKYLYFNWYKVSIFKVCLEFHLWRKNH